MGKLTTIMVTEYLGHGGREEHSELWDPDAPQQEIWHYSLYEVALDLEVDLDTGKSRIVAVDGRSLVSFPEFR